MKLEDMSLIMDNRLNHTSDKDEELRRLQELVKKLETQNHELKTERQAILSHAKSMGSLNIIDENNISNFKNRLSIIENVSSNSVNLMESSVAPIDLADLNISDDETWLVSSPKTKPKAQLMSWLRKDVDDPSVIVLRKSLAIKIEEIGGSGQSSPRHSIYSPGSSGILSPESPKEIDTRTFVRPKKRQLFTKSAGHINGNSTSSTSDSPIRTSNLKRREGSREYLGNSNGSLGSEEDRLSSTSEGSFTSFRLADVEDVNALAKLQEESLRLPEPRPLNRLTDMKPSTHRLSSKCNGSDYSAGSSQEDLLTTYQSPRKIAQKSSLLAPKKYQYSGLPQSTSRESSDLSSPAESPYNSQQNLVYANGRRMPSLTRRSGAEPAIIDGDSPVTSRGASPMLHEPIENRAGSRVSRLQTPQARTSKLAAPSPVRLPPNLNSDTARSKQSGLPQSRLRKPKSVARSETFTRK